MSDATNTSLTEAGLTEAGLVLTLPSEISIDTMLDVIDQVKDCVGAIGLSGSAVEVMDTPGLQILLSISKTLNHQNRPFSLTDVSGELGACFATFGIDPQTMEPAT